MPAVPRSSKTLRAFAACGLILALVSVAAAQAVVATFAVEVQAITEAVIGRAPIVTVMVQNQTRPGEAPIIGATLRATANADDPDHDTITATSYRWRRGEIEIASTQTYTVVGADVGGTLSVEAIATTDAAITEPASGTGSTSVAIEGTAPEVRNVRFAGGIWPDGRARLEFEQTCLYDFYDAENDADVSTFQWYRADNPAGTGKTEIANATGASYTPMPNTDNGVYLVCEVTAKSPKLPTTGLSASATRKVDSRPVGSAPAITGTLQNGAVATAEYSFFDADDDDESGTLYRWFRADDALGTNKAPIPGGNAKTLTLSVAELNRHLIVEITPATFFANVEGARISATRGPVPGTPPRIANIAIDGEWAEGGVVGATFDLLDDESDQIDYDATQYQWFVSDATTGLPVAVPAPEGTTRFLRLRKADVGSNRTVWFSVEKAVTKTGTPNSQDRPISPPGQWQGSRTGNIAENLPPTAAGLGISGALEFGATVGAEWTYADPEHHDPGAIAYQWFAADDASGTNKIPIGVGQTQFIYTEQMGKVLGFTVTPSDARGAIGAEATFFAHKEVPYVQPGFWIDNLPQSISANAFVISGRAGNAPSQLEVAVTRDGYVHNMAGDSRPNCVLIAPNGVRFTLACPLASSTETTTIDASAIPANGTWTFEARPSLPNNGTHGRLTRVTLDFTP